MFWIISVLLSDLPLSNIEIRANGTVAVSRLLTVTTKLSLNSFAFAPPLPSYILYSLPSKYPSRKSVPEVGRTVNNSI